MLGKDYAGQECLIARALEVVGERWTLLIVRDAFFGVTRYSDFLAHLDIPRAVLSDRLKGLVDNGILVRRPDPDRPGRDRYSLTEAGLDLWPIIYALKTWGERHRLEGDPRRIYTHAACGTAIDDSGTCPTCLTAPHPREIVVSLSADAERRRDDPVSVALREPHRLLAPLSV